LLCLKTFRMLVYEFVKCLYDELLSPQTQAKNVIEYFFGELFEGFAWLLFDIHGDMIATEWHRNRIGTESACALS
jgi:hypothetical protein